MHGQSENQVIENLQWQHENEWLYCERCIRLSASALIHVRDVIRWKSTGLLEWHRLWWHEEPHVINRLELFTAVEGSAPLRSHLLPANLYDGNAGSSLKHLVPRTAYGTPNLFEEHRYPTPMVHVELQEEKGPRWGLTLHVTPCPVIDGHVPDQWWSLGFEATNAHANPVLLSVSGHVSMNGQDEIIYDAQCHVSPYKDAWVDARPRHVYEKHYELELQADVPVRQGWRAPLRRVLAEQPALTGEELLWLSRAKLDKSIQLKVDYALRRWKEDENCCGMDMWPARFEPLESEEIARWVPRGIFFGDGGGNMLLATSLWRRSQQTGQVDLAEKGMRVAESWLRAATEACRANCPAPSYYTFKTKSWRLYEQEQWMEASRPTGVALDELAKFCLCLRAAGKPRPDWEEQLNALLVWYSQPERRWKNGLFPFRWDKTGKPVGEEQAATAGLTIATALADASELPGCTAHLQYAEELMHCYANTFLGSMAYHPCGAPPDSNCQDCESGMLLLTASLAIHRAQRIQHRVDPRILSYATQAADWTLTFNYTWNVPMVPGTLLASLPFTTRGWCDVSVQNRHVHVYSPVRELMRLADALPPDAGKLYREQAQRMAVPIIRTIARPECRWGMSEDGEQTEQYNHTNFVMGATPDANPSLCSFYGPRGGIGRWFPSWLTAWVLAICMDILERDGQA